MHQPCIGANAASSCKNNCFGPNIAGEAVAVTTALGAIIGTVVGVAIPGDGWREVYRR